MADFQHQGASFPIFEDPHRVPAPLRPRESAVRQFPAPEAPRRPIGESFDRHEVLLHGLGVVEPAQVGALPLKREHLAKCSKDALPDFFQRASGARTGSRRS